MVLDHMVMRQTRILEPKVETLKIINYLNDIVFHEMVMFSVVSIFLLFKRVILNIFRVAKESSKPFKKVVNMVNARLSYCKL